jgi:plasmid stabilization system protein ParE
VKLQLSPAAEADLRRIFLFNIQRSATWAEKVELRLLERARSLLVTPRAGRVTREAGIRRLSVPDIQYVLDYRIMEDRIRILRIYSTREIR